MSILDLIEQVESVCVPEQKGLRVEISDGDGNVKYLTFGWTSQSLSDIEALIKTHDQQLLAIDDDLNRYKLMQASYTDKDSLRMMADMIRLTLSTRQHIFDDRERLQGLVSKARKGALGYV
jgi:hypothetical protein